MTEQPLTQTQDHHRRPGQFVHRNKTGAVFSVIMYFMYVADSFPIGQLYGCFPSRELNDDTHKVVDTAGLRALAAGRWFGIGMEREGCGDYELYERS